MTDADLHPRPDDGPGDAIERRLRRPLTRRRFLLRATQAGLALGAAGIGIGGYLVQQRASPWDASVFPPPGRSSVAVLRAPRYEADLEGVIANALRLLGVDVRGKSVLLKPNIVEFDPTTVINTDPRLVAATAAAMRSAGARQVTVGEGSGHRRDSHFIAGQSGLLDLLRDVDVPFVDLNTAAVSRVALDSHFTSLGELWLPAPVTEADLVVSMPKLKTHHWGGVTLSLKNMFGTVPGRIYGWPKNVLHWAGLEESILDVAAAVPPQLAIVDGIVGMQGDGPIKGSAVDVGVILAGTDPVAVDSTAARLMGIDPARVGYLEEAGRFLGQLTPELIDQIGEDPEDEAVHFELLPQFSSLRIGSPAPADDPAQGEDTGA
ncbi:MAG TPA: DUF362 domain-containing protein [Candidatus Limnocylindria bacterium]|nr:DUF362 domain-containing protein [Candidatus Limnocylindria bacterium]